LPKPRQAVFEMAPYSPPTGAREDKIRLDFNEHTVGCSPKVIEFIRDSLASGKLAMYPEYTAAIRELAEFFQVSRDELMLTNGTDEAIQVFVNTYVDRGDDVVLLKPTYAMYRFYSDLAGGRVREVEYLETSDLTFPIEELLAALTPQTRALMIANPNNPTGTGVDLNDVRRVLDAAPQTAVLIDEAYYEFSGKTTLGWIREYPNLFVSRTFSKVYGMAAMRCGCLFSSAENVKWLRKAQSPYSVNMLAALATRAAVRDHEHVAQWVAEVLEAREMVCAGLTRLGIRYFASEANFVLFQAGDRAIPIRDALRDRGVLVRDRSYEIPGCVRVTMGTSAQMQSFLSELELLCTA
jgi:histidinol-phosphate aminotransferase